MSIALKSALLVLLVACVAAIMLRRDRFVNVPIAGSMNAPASDKQVLQQLRKAGADLTKATEVNYYLYFPDSVTASHAADSARAFGFDAEVRDGRGRAEWLCLATKNMIPDTIAIFAATKELSDLTRSLHGEYDGWEAALTK
jgi:hypothetical protein